MKRARRLHGRDLHVTDDPSSCSATTTEHPHTWAIAEIVSRRPWPASQTSRGSFKTTAEQRIDALDTYLPDMSQTTSQSRPQDVIGGQSS